MKKIEKRERILNILDTHLQHPYVCSGEIQWYLQKEGIDIDEVRSVLGRSYLLREMNRSINTRDTQSPILPMALSFLSLVANPAWVSEEITSLLDLDAVSSPATLQLKSPDFFLCDKGEDYLIDAVQNERAILVDDHLLLKSDGKTFGKLAALSVHTAKTPTGEFFFRGHWYVPTTGKEELKAAFASGEKQITTTGVTWSLVRPLYWSEKFVSATDTLAHAGTYVRRLRS